MKKTESSSSVQYLASVARGMSFGVVTAAVPIFVISKSARVEEISIEKVLILIALFAGAIIGGIKHTLQTSAPSVLPERTKMPASLKEYTVRFKALISSNWDLLLLTSYVMLNTASAALCRRMGYTMISQQDETILGIRIFGLVVVVLGCLYLGWAMIHKRREIQENVDLVVPGNGNGTSHKSSDTNGKKNGNGNGSSSHSDEKESAADETKKITALPMVQYPDLTAWLVILTGVSYSENVWLPLIGLPGVVVAMKWFLAANGTQVKFPSDGAQLDVSSAKWKIVPFIF